MDHVDLVVLSRDEGPLRSAVHQGIACQSGVVVHLHRVIGRPTPTDACRWETIARARNLGKDLGTSPWLMFLDDDVVLAAGCLRTLVDELLARPAWGALAAAYLREPWERTSRHVGMGATLFRRAAIRRIGFRWEPGRCECQCCCDDLRRLGLAISYSPSCHAVHLTSPGSHACPHPHPVDDRMEETGSPEGLAGQILTAFDHRHYDAFRDQFLRSLRYAGNTERVWAVGYGLSSGQQRALAGMTNVELVALPNRNDTSPALRRLTDFQKVIADWNQDTPVAHWDAGDVIFQASLTPLWELVTSEPNRFLLTREPKGHPENQVVREWTLSIHDPLARRTAFQLLSQRPWLAAGFTAGTTRTLSRYLRAAENLRHSPAMKGTADWGDATAFNIHCHRNPTLWREISESWNFCLWGRGAGEVWIGNDGAFCHRGSDPICVVHGNAGTLPTIQGFELLSETLAARRDTICAVPEPH